MERISSSVAARTELVIKEIGEGVSHTFQLQLAKQSEQIESQVKATKEQTFEMISGIKELIAKDKSSNAIRNKLEKQSLKLME
jgi:urate oxidase